MTPGDQISRYRIIRRLGGGGMGVVYLAEDTRLGRKVALKFLPVDNIDRSAKQRLLSEAQAAAAIRHPNVCTIHDIEEADGNVFISMDYVEGETLASRLARGPMPVAEAVRVLIEITRGLATAHAAGIVHRDIKSSNIVLGSNNCVCILDFGLALRSGADRLTQTGAVIGTPLYMSPEQFTGKPVDARTDIWSLGVLMFEMLTGEVPFRRENPAALAHAVLHDAVPDVSARQPLVPRELQAIVEKALERDPARRWRSTRELEVALQPFASTLPDGQTATMRTPAPVVADRRRWVAASLLAALIAAIAGGVFLLRKPGQQPSPVSRSDARTEKLIAILPAIVQTSSAETKMIADGVTEVLSSSLSELERSERTIAAVPAAEILRRKITSAAEARRFYGAQYVVVPAAQQAGVRTEFHLSLVDTGTSRDMGSVTFVYDPALPVASRQTAVDRLATLLGVAPPRSKPSDSATPQASHEYLKARGFLSRYDVAGNVDRAIEHLRRAVAADPGYALAHAALADALWRKGRTGGDPTLSAEAFRVAVRSVQLEPGLVTARTTLAAIHTTGGRTDDAIRELQTALRLAPGSAEVHRELARVYATQGRFGEAEASYRQAIAARPTDWYGYLLLGLLHNEKLDYVRALDVFQQAARLTPDNEVVQRNLGVALLSLGKYEQAVSHLQQSLKLKANATTYASLGAAFYRQHRFTEALAAVETALDIDPQRYYFWGNLGIYCKWNPGSEGRSKPALEKAVELALKYIRVSPNDYDARADLGEYYARIGKAEAALAEIEKIPDSARPFRLSRIAIVYELTGNRRKAIPLIAASKTPAILLELRDDPDLAGLWSDAEIRRLAASAF